MIDLPVQDLTTIKRILAKLVPECEARVFGSRVTWKAKSNSDIDLVIIGKEKLSRETFSLLKSVFEDSALQVRVDLIDWHRVSDEFHKNITKQYETIQHPRTTSSVPEGWFYRKVSEIAEVVGGGTPNTRKSEFWEGTIPWLTPKDLSEDHPRYVSRGDRSITKEGLQNCSARILPPRAVLLTSRAPVGYLALAKNTVTTNQGFRSLIVNAENDPEFVYYLLLNNTEYLKQHASGSTFQELSGSVLKSLEFLFPPLPEQRAIAHILGSLDDKIELNCRMNRTLEAMARAIFKSWFIDFDPVRAKAEGRPTGLPDDIAALFPDSFDDSELGEIPKGWGVKTIGEAVECVGGSTPSTKNPAFWDGGKNPFVTPKDMSSLTSPVILDTSRHITDAGVDKISSGRLPIGTVILSSRAPIGYLAITKVPVSVNQGVIAMICNKDLPNYYVLYWTETNMETIKSNAGGTTFAEISKRNFRPIPVVVPHKLVLDTFVQHVEPLHKQLVLNLQEANSLASLRDILLPKLISGDLRLPAAALEELVAQTGVTDADKFVEEVVG